MNKTQNNNNNKTKDWENREKVCGATTMGCCWYSMRMIESASFDFL